MFTTFHRLAVAGGVALALAAGSSGAAASQSTQSAPAAAAAASSSTQAASADEALDQVAKLLGRAVSDANLRQQIRSGIIQQAKADNAVEYRALSSSSSMRTHLAAAYRVEHAVTEAAALQAVDQLTVNLPPTQLSVPVKFTAWTPTTYAPWVGYVPAGVDDEEVTTITAYDTTGGKHLLDASAEPNQPVIILGPDETQISGSTAASSATSSASKSVATAAAPSCYEARLTYTRLWDDHEPWFKGMAEIFLVAKGSGVYYKDEFPYLEMDGDQYWPDERLGCAKGDVTFYWWEDDSSAFDFALEFGGVSLGVGMSDEDDLIGGRILPHASFEGSTERNTSFTDLEMKTK